MPLANGLSRSCRARRQQGNVTRKMFSKIARSHANHVDQDMSSNDEIGGKIIGWGTGQTQSAVNKTEALTKSLTRAKVEEMVQKGLTKDWVKKQFSMYEAALRNPAK